MALAVLLAAAATSCSSTSSWTGSASVGSAASAGASQAPAAGVRGGAAAAAARLAQLPVRPQTGDDTYRREAYGPRWADVTGSGCNTRDQVLYASAAPGVRSAVQGRCPHDVLAGTWTDYYTGSTLSFTDLKDPRQAQAITLDHLVALAEADRSGASTWTADRRKVFANDPANLRVTAGAVNSAKGDLDPASWLPPEPVRCDYAAAHVAVKHAWQLAVDQAEHDALDRLLRRCPTG